MDTKLNLTIYDVMTYLIPGSIFMISVCGLFAPNWVFQLNVSLQIILLILSGFLCGTVLSIIGLLLFKGIFPYDYEKRPIIRHLVNAIDTLVALFPLLRTKSVDKKIRPQLDALIKKKLDISVEKDSLLRFVVSDTYTASKLFNERDILLAKEGFFRSMTALILTELLMVIILNPFNNRLAVALIGTLLLELFRYSREYYRQLKNQQIYFFTYMGLKHE